MTSSEDFLRESVRRVTAGETLSALEMGEVVQHLMKGELSQTPFNLLASALICSIKTRRETVEEIVGAARTLKSHQRHVKVASSTGALLDTCGTGGDGAHLINISTITSLVVASLGVTVAKHGNRSVSSSCGSADLLEALGYPLLNDPDLVSRCAANTGFGFLYAPHFHPALKNLAGLRRSLGVRTIFNMLGPLVNPAGVTHQLMGVFDRNIVTPIAKAAGQLGIHRCCVVHGEGGLDEISPCGVTYVALSDREQVTEFEWTPRSFGADPVALSCLVGGDAHANAATCRRLLKGELPEMARAVAMNCAASLWVVNPDCSLEEGYTKAYEAIVSGEVARFFDKAKDYAVSVS